MIDPELQALLSGYAAGTLTPEEKKRLNEAALKNQAIFDAMAEEEPLRAALTSSLAREGLVRALQPKQKSNNWLWAALAASLFVGAATVAYRPSPKQETQEVAVAIKPQAVAAPVASPEVKPTPKARPKAPLSPPPPAPAQVPVVIPESTSEKLETKSVTQVAASAAALADSDRSSTRSTLRIENSFQQANLPSKSKMASANVLPPAEIFNDNLVLRTSEGNQIYAFLIDGESVKPLSTINEARRSIPIGAHSTRAEVWLIVTPVEDPVLARALTGVLPLPNRNWIKLKTNP